LPTWPKLYWLLIILFFLVRAFLWENISTKALYDFDEARYAEVAKNVIKTNNWLVPLAGGPDEPRKMPYLTLNNGSQLYPYFWKPPFHTLVISVFYRLFGVNELAVRLPSLLSGFGILIIVFFLARKYWPKQRILPYLAVALLVTHNDFGFLTSYGNSDSLLLFLSLLSLYFALDKSLKTAVLAGVFMGLAFLTKSVAVYWLPLIIFCQFLFLQTKDWFRRLVIIASVFMLALIPWHLFMCQQFGSVFINRFFLANTFERAAGLSGNQAPIYWYLIYLLNFWQGLVFFGVILAWKVSKALVAKKKDCWFLILWILLILVPFSLMSSKVWWYIFPIIIPVVLLFSKSIADLEIKTNWQKVAIFCLIIFVLVFNLSFSYQESQKRTNHNLPLKVLARRHSETSSLSVYKIPYETALFYFDTGNIDRNNFKAKYLLTKKDFLPDLIKKYKLIDNEDEFYLLIK